MTREQKVVETLVELASAMVDDFDVVEFLHLVSIRSVDLLACDEAGLLLADAGGTLRVMASSSERSEALELLQAQNREGPCFECWVNGTPVWSEDLEAEGRWSAFTPVALAMEFRSVQAVPMRVHGTTIGALNLFRRAPGRVAEADLSLVQGMADIAAVALLQERSLRETRGLVGQLQHALRSRVIIEQAKGALAERAQIGVDDAFLRLRAHARSHNRRLSDVAGELVDGSLDPSPLVHPEARTATGDR